MHADDHYRDLKNYVSSIGKHSHICMVYSDREQQITALTEYFKTGLRLGQQCIYVSDKDTARFVQNVMRRTGMDVEADIADGSLIFLTPEETYLAGGHFDADRMIDMVETLIGEAYSSGFNGLRGAGEMGWALGANVSGKDILAYESKINKLFEQYPFIGLCQYDSSRFHQDAVRMLINTHPTVFQGGEIVKNPSYLHPNEFIKILDEHRELQLAV